MVKKKAGRPTEKIIKNPTKLPFEINFDFTIGRADKYKNDKKVKTIIKNENKQK